MSTPGLKVLTALPDGFLECEASELHRVLGGPTLIDLAGEHPEALFICTLLHGNETTGFQSLQRVLKGFGDGPLPRSVCVFIGNVEAARYQQRRLPDQPDYNRIWADGDSLEHELTRSVIAYMSRRGVFACIDVHNNTGRNPHYSIVATRDARHLALAAKFGNQVVYATYPDTGCSVAFARLCPSITVEAGVVRDASGVEHVSRFLDDCIRDDGWLHTDSQHLDLYHTVAVVKVQQSCSIGVLGQDTDLELLPDVDSLNFRMLEPGTRLGLARNGGDRCLFVQGVGEREDVTDYIAVTEGELRTVKPLMPAMLTTDCDIIKMDCLCYLMERIR